MVWIILKVNKAYYSKEHSQVVMMIRHIKAYKVE